MTQSQIINTSVGRYVYGSLTEKRTEDFEGRPIPEDKQQYEIGVAYRKDDPRLPAVFQAYAGHMYNEFSKSPAIQQKIATAAQYFPQYPQALDGFSWKISDGDAPNRKGQVSEHTRGHWIFYFKSSFPIKCANQQNAEIPGDQVKRGYYVDVAFTCAGNGEQGDRAGGYLNPQFVRLIAYGEEIRGGVSAAEAFANAPVPSQLPPGASAMPIAGNPAAMPGAPALGSGLPQGVGMTTSPQGMPQQGFPQPGAHSRGIPAAAPQALAPVAGQPAGFAPSQVPPANGAFPSNPAPQSGFPGAPAAIPQGGAFGAQLPQNAPSPTGYPSNVQPHPTFAAGPGYPGT